MKKKMITKNAFYAQSGGVTAVINASACAVIETAKKHRTNNWKNLCWKKWNSWSIERKSY